MDRVESIKPWSIVLANEKTIASKAGYHETNSNEKLIPLVTDEGYHFWGYDLLLGWTNFLVYRNNVKYIYRAT